MRTMSAALRCCLLALVATLGFATVAHAAAPEARTTGVNGVTSGGATLLGTVDPNSRETTYFFEYGKTRRYGSRTPDTSAGKGDTRQRVSVKVDGLEPNTTYHFRVVARNADGVRSGADRTFKTRKQPLGLQISTTPNPVSFGSPTAIFGALTGTGNANQNVQLQQRAFPFTAGWADFGSPVVTDANGGFGIAVLPLPATTQFRVRLVDKPNVISEVITQAVAARVRTTTNKKRVRRNKKVRVYGSVRPNRVGVPFEIQKRTKLGSWVVVRRGLTKESSDPEAARYSRRVRVPRTARYRVLVNTAAGDVIAGFGPEFRVKVKKRS